MRNIASIDLRTIAFKYYNHIKRTRKDVDFILCNINENYLEKYVKTYLNSSQFNVNLNIRGLWNQTKKPDEPSLTGIQEDILIFILNMYCCEQNKEKRALKLKRHNV